MRKATTAVPIELPEVPEIRLADRLHTDQNLLLWQVQGWSEVQVEDETCRLPPGHLYWVPAGRPHGIVVESGAVTLPTFFPVSTPVPADDLPADDLPADDILVDDILVEAACLPMTPALAQGLPMLVQAQYTALRPAVDLRPAVLALIREAARAATAELPTPVAPPAREIARYLWDHPADRRSLAQWAAWGSTSPRTVERAFRTGSGMTFSQWRQRNRMRNAVALLREGRPVSEVARRVGYLDHSAFSRAFRSQFGVEPRAYRLAGALS